MKLEQRYRKAATTSFCAVIFFIADSYVSSVYFRICTIVFACFPFYYWIQYLKAYIDYKIDSVSAFLPRNESGRENDDNQPIPS